MGAGRARWRDRLVGLRGAFCRRLGTWSGDVVVLGAGRPAGRAQRGDCGRALRGYGGSAARAGLLSPAAAAYWSWFVWRGDWPAWRKLGMTLALLVSGYLVSGALGSLIQTVNSTLTTLRHMLLI